MSRAPLIAAIAIVLIGAGIAAWLLLPAAPTAGNVEEDTAGVPANSSGDAPTRGPVGNRPAVPDPERSAQDPMPADQPRDGSWLVRGRIAFAPELANRVPVQDEWNRVAQIYFLADGSAPADVFALFSPLDENHAFAQTISQSDLNFAEGAGLKPGKWQVLYGHDGDTPPSLRDHGEVDLAALTGIVTPKITGRVIDFGTVTIGEDHFFYGYVILSGRLLHSSGVALGNSSDQYLSGSLSEDDDLYGPFRTAADGSFLAMCSVTHQEELAKLKHCAWRLVHRSFDDWMIDEHEGGNVGQPVWNGRRADFGDVKLPGALVEIVLHGIEVAPLPDTNRSPEYDGWSAVTVTFSSSEDSIGSSAFSPPRINRCVMPEGRYFWEARADGFYPILNGVLIAREGQVHRVDLDFTPFSSIPLVIVKAAPAPDNANDNGGLCWVGWQVRSAEKVIGSGSAYYEEDPRVPVAEECETEVTVACPGFKTAEAVAKSGMERLEVVLELEAAQTVEEQTATLIVVGAASPKGIAKSTLKAVLRVSLPGSEPSLIGGEWGEGDIEHAITLRAVGQGTVTLEGGKEWGYPGGILSGPVEFAIAAGETRRIELPPIADPPWAKPISKFHVRVSASGSPLKILRVPLRYEDGGEPEQESFHNGGTLAVRGYPVALTDGREDYPLTLTPGDDGTANLEIDLPHTLEVRLTRRGKAIDQFTVWAATYGEEAPDLYVQCEADSVDGLAKLWLPRGRADVHVWFGSVSISQEVDLIPGQVVRVEAVSPYLELKLEVPETAYDRHAHDFDAPELWTLQARDAAGIWSDCDAVARTTAYMLQAGSYRVVPWNGAEHVKIELTEDKTVRLPAIAVPKFGSVILKFDLGELHDSEATPRFGYTLSVLLKPNQVPDESLQLQSTLVPDGFKLSGVPMGADIAIWGSVWVDDGSDGYELLLRPLTLRATSDGQQHEAVILRAVSLDGEWQDLNARWITPVENLQFEVGETALPGRQEILIRDGRGAIVLREWVVVPESSEEPFKIPDALRSELESNGLIEPREEE